MIRSHSIRIVQNTLSNVVLVYDVGVEDNTPWMFINSVEYDCLKCGKTAYVDLTVVPACDAFIECCECENPLTKISEYKFQIKLSPDCEKI